MTNTPSFLDQQAPSVRHALLHHRMHVTKAMLTTLEHNTDHLWAQRVQECLIPQGHYDQKRHAHAETLHQTLHVTYTYGAINWPTLLSSCASTTSFGNCLHFAQTANVPFLAVVNTDRNVNDSYFESHDVVSMLVFPDSSFLIFLNGWMLSTDLDGSVFQADAPWTSLLHDAQKGRVAVLAHHGLESDLGTKDSGPGFWNTATALFYDSQDPPFNPDDETSWSSIEEDTVHQEALRLFIALGGPEAYLECSIEGKSEEGDGGVARSYTESDGIDADLFADCLDALCHLSTAEGGAWEYNDGAYDRQSGYSFHHTLFSLRFDSDDRTACSAHEQLAMRRSLLEQATTDPRLAPMRERITALLAPTPHQDTSA